MNEGTSWGEALFWVGALILAILTLGEPDLLDAIVAWGRTWSNACP